MLRLTPVTLLFGTILATTSMAQQSAAPSQGTAQLQQVASFEHQVTGVSVSKDGRIFVNFPRWTEDAPISVAEVTRDGQIKPYPDDEWNSWRNPRRARRQPEITSCASRASSPMHRATSGSSTRPRQPRRS